MIQQNYIFAALSAVHSYTRGSSRLIDNLMTDAIAIGSQKKCKVINADIIHDAVRIRFLIDEVFNVQCNEILDVIALFQNTLLFSFEIRLQQSAVSPLIPCSQ